MRRLYSHFSNTIVSDRQRIGCEVETSFMHRLRAASLAETQAVFRKHMEATPKKWRVVQKKDTLITKLEDEAGNCLQYELGRQNIELSVAPHNHMRVIGATRRLLDKLYHVAYTEGLTPHFGPLCPSSEDTLLIAEKRDEMWLELDGRAALAPLAKISAVQFTFDVDPKDAIPCLNRLGKALPDFLVDYPQEAVWQKYVRDSRAGYDPLRYGGPVLFESLEDYCTQLARHDVIQNGTLVPYKKATEIDIPLHVRSVWWHFRLRRNQNALCIEVRPLPRCHDDNLANALCSTLDRMLG